MSTAPEHTHPVGDYTEQSIADETPDRTASGLRPSTRPHRGAPRTSKMIGLCATAAVALLALAVSGCGSTIMTRTVTSPPSSTSSAVPHQSPAGKTATTHPAPAPTAATPAIVYAGSGSGETACGNELAVGPDTTCAFAENVRSAYGGTGPGTVTAYSPVTNKTYAMTCSAGDEVVCTGGDNASVYFPSDSAGAAYETTQPSSGEATPSVAHASGYSGKTACGDELSVGADTTCAFAENVRSAYDSTGPGTVTAFSPVTHKTYSLTCSAGDPVVCTGGDRASVYFP